MTDIEEYLLALVPKTHQMTFTGAQGITRTKEFLKLLGSPQNTLKVVHIAGTSGKGSTSFMISNLLTSQGFRVGLHLSPHLLDVRERMMINNDLISKQKFIAYFADVFPCIKKMEHSAWGKITYFEALVGMAFYVFAQEKVDYAVMETGLGGLYDGTNIVERTDKLSVITKIGFDHMNVLGNTLSKIAYQKAMICVQGGELITTKQFPTAQKEIERVVREKKGQFFLAKKWGNTILLGLRGEFQKGNAALALTTLTHLSKRDGFPVQIDSVRDVLKNLRFKGRFDVISKQNGGEIILDGAHNVQKMKAFLTSVRHIFPGRKFIFIIAFKQGKEYKKMLKLIIPFTQKILITHIFSQHQDLMHMSVSSTEIERELKRLRFTHFEMGPNLNDLGKMIQKGSDSYIITGSLYLLGDIYKMLN